MIRITGYGFLALLLLSGAALAETEEGGAPATTIAATESGGYESLSTGNRSIADALFAGRSGSTGDPGTGDGTGDGSSWSLDDIAAAKQDGQGWGQIFKQMKEDGATDARNLGELVSRHRRELNGSLDAENRGLTTAGRGAATADGDESVTSVASGDGGGAGEAGGSAQNTGPDTAEIRHGTYKEMSPGNRKIVDSLFDSQSIGPEGTQAWSLDRIGTARADGQGWGDIFHQMKQDGLIQAGNLGQVVSGRYQAGQVATAGAAAITVTNGSGRQRAVGGPSGGGRSGGGQSGSGQSGSGHSGAGHGVTTAGGSRAGGIVTAGGASAGARAGASLNSSRSSTSRGRTK